MANPVVVLDDTLYDIADAIRAKTGGSADMTPSQMPAQIASIPSGGGEGIPREVNANGVYGMPTQNFTFSLPANAVGISGYALYRALSSCTTLTSVDLSSLTTISGGYALSGAFSSCSSLTSVDLSSLATVSGAQALDYAFGSCSTLTSVDLSSLTTVSGEYALNTAFSGCAALTSVDLSSLTTVSGARALSHAFSDCAALTSVDLSSLATVSGSQAFDDAFSGCTSLASLSFPALTASSFGSYTNQFNDMLFGVTGCTVHFPAAIQSIIEGMTGYPNFGGTNTTVLFDL